MGAGGSEERGEEADELAHEEDKRDEREEDEHLHHYARVPECSEIEPREFKNIIRVIL